MATVDPTSPANGEASAAVDASAPDTEDAAASPPPAAPKSESAAPASAEAEAGGGSAGEGGTAPAATSLARSYNAATLTEIRYLGLYQAVLLIALLGLTLLLWPSPEQLQSTTGVEAEPAAAASDASLSDQLARLPFNRRVLLMVIIVGMLGSVIGGSASFVTYVGNGTFRGSWLWWYGLRPLMGAALALVLYFVAQAGFIDNPTLARAEGKLEQVFYAAVAIAGLAGMFSKLTADKLEEVFATILQSDGDAKRANKLDD